jgi:hypothetical protein
MSRQFAARFPGTCGHCDHDITPGQIVEFIDDDLVHVRCPPPPAICPSCHFVIPVSGVCETCQ